ncbi:RNA polymerase sigma factor [Demequina sediminicola]|uniref:RNA polymerase sigma factor n=1 Tax=Demequina sediminicola TaxID=1095026 RepID=UPI00078217E1|nr:RNA polymerase sigma factor [Demequina sediminicola]
MGDVLKALDANSADLLQYLERRIGITDAPDVLSDVMTIAWRRTGDVPDDPEQARMWLFGIAKRSLANAHRGEVRRANLADRLRWLAYDQGPVAPAADDGLTTRDCIAALPEPLAEIVRLVHWDGLTLAEVAQLEEVAPSTVRSRYARAKEMLRAMLEEEPLASVARLKQRTG